MNRLSLARRTQIIGALERRAPVDARRRSHRSANAGRAKRGISITTEAKFSGLQGLENSQNGERISTFREPVRLPAKCPASTRRADAEPTEGEFGSKVKFGFDFDPCLFDLTRVILGRCRIEMRGCKPSLHVDTAP
jgi:hypothetical protein